MRALHIFVTIALSFSSIAYDNSRLQWRGDVPGNAVDGLGISYPDLSVVSTSNTSDANSLIRNSKRALDDMHLVRRQRAIKMITTLIVINGRFTGTVDFGHHRISAMFDTGASMTWIKAKNSATEAPPFKSMGFLKLKGQRAVATVTVDRLIASEMEFRMVQPEVDTEGYDGGLTLDRSRVSWPNYVHARPLFAFHSKGPNHAEFHFGTLDPNMMDLIHWYPVNPHNNVWTLESGRINVNGKAVQVLDGFSAYMDTGVPYVYGSANSVAKLYQQLRGSRYLNGFWTVPCNKPPVVSFMWGTTNVPIHDFLVDGQVHGKTYCRGVIRPRSGLPDHEFYLGIAFFYGKYIVFSKMENMLGIGVL